MYSLTIHFGPNAICWALLFKEQEKASVIYNDYVNFQVSEGTEGMLIGADDFGQAFAISMHQISGIMLEDLDQTEAARIQRSLSEERCKVKLMQAARTDPVIGPAMRGGGAPVLTPMGGFRQ